MRLLKYITNIKLIKITQNLVRPEGLEPSTS